jgi:hypothetical protein
MSIYEIIKSIQRALLVAAIVVAVAIVFGALFALSGAGDFPVGFWLTVIVITVAGLLLKYSDEW